MQSTKPQGGKSIKHVGSRLQKHRRRKGFYERQRMKGRALWKKTYNRRRAIEPICRMPDKGQKRKGGECSILPEMQSGKGSQGGGGVGGLGLSKRG